MSLARGEFSAAEYGQKAKKSEGKGIPVRAINFYNIHYYRDDLRSKSGGSNSKNISHRRFAFMVLLSMMNSGRGSHSGSWGGFSGGGGGGGGFGGFGGGSFGGGGAGGSW